MKYDSKLLNSLVDKADHYQEEVAVFRIRRQTHLDQEKDAVDLAQRFMADHGIEQPRYSLTQKRSKTRIELPEGASLSLYHPSGAMTVARGWRPFEKVIASDAEKVDRKALIKQAEEAVRRLRLDRSTKAESLRFERLWQLKASGMTQEGKRGPTALTRAVGAFRRYLYDLPVWGRASVFAKLSAEGQVDATGVDWRQVESDPFDRVRVLDPEEGGKRVIEELQTFLPNTTFTLEDYEPEQFSLGYLSFPKRRTQTIMQPVWVAMLQARGKFTLGRLIVVPAAPISYEPISRIPAAPPSDIKKPEPELRRGG